MFKEDLESKRTSQQDKHDLIRIMVMFSNLSCTLIPISLWWLFFKSFTGVSIEYLNILPYLFYPFTVIVYWLFIILWSGNAFKQRHLPDYGNQRVQAREIILEQRQLDWSAFVGLFFLPIVVVIVLIFYGFAPADSDRLFNNKNFILAAFSVGALVLGFMITIRHCWQSHHKPRQAADIVNLLENAAGQIQSLNRQLQTDSLHPSGIAFEDSANPDLISKLVKRAELSTPEKNALAEIKTYYNFDLGAMSAWFYRLFRHIADTAALLFNDFMNGVKEMSGTAMVLIAVLAFKTIIATENKYLYPDAQTCRILIDLWPLPIQFIPALLAVLTTVIGLVIGSSWGVFAVMFPFIMMVKTVLPDEQLSLMMQQAILNASLGAVISAAAFINQSSKQADNLVMAASLTGMDIANILAITKKRCWTCAIISLIGYVIAGCFMF